MLKIHTLPPTGGDTIVSGLRNLIMSRSLLSGIFLTVGKVCFPAVGIMILRTLTVRCSGYAAYDKLSPAYQKFLEGLTAVHIGDGFVKVNPLTSSLECGRNIELFSSRRKEVFLCRRTEDRLKTMAKT